MDEVSGHCKEKLYVVTHDLGMRIQNLRSLGLETPEADHLFFGSFQDELKAKISKILPDVKVVSYDMKSLGEKIWAEAVKHQASLKDCVVLSTCAELASPRRGHLIEVNRIVNHDGDVIGLGPRPGNPSLNDQIAGIARAVQGKQVVLIEDGAFSGQTLEYVIGRLLSHRINVSAVVVGICFPSAIKKISSTFRGNFVVIEESTKPFEWMPDHDFIPFAPNCGRVFGGNFGNEVLPHYSHDGLSYCFPYVRPFGNPAKWASIPTDHVGEFSLFCVRKALELFELLEEMNDREITISDLKGSTPRISLPITAGSSGLSNPDMNIVSFLRETCQEIA